MKEQTISKATIDRLPLYYRTLRLAQDDGMDIISSDELGRRLELTPEQIRKDLALFGQFGKKGVGYYVNELKFNVGKILGLDNHWNIAKTVNHVKVKSIDELQSCAKNLKIDIGVIAVPAQFAQQVADKLVKANIKGIWNFAPVKMRVPEDVKIVNEDLSVGLSRLSYYITGK